MLSLFADILTVLGFIISLFQIKWDDLSWETNYVCYISAVIFFVATIFFTTLCLRKYKKINRCRDELSEYRHTISEMETDLQDKNFDNCHEKLGLICSHISDSLSEMKGNRISVCVKILIGMNTRSKVECLVRDYKSILKRRYKVGGDYLNENSDFHSIVKNYKNKIAQQKWHDFHYINNNLPHSYDYRNSHLDSNVLSTGLIGLFLRHKQWNLDYKSTMTVPISDTGSDTFYGFLCIDSSKPYQFNKKSDLVIVKGLASDLWRMTDLTLTRYKEERNRKNG